MQQVLEAEADRYLSDDLSDTTELGHASEVSSLVSPASDTFDESIAAMRYPARDRHELCLPDHPSFGMTFTWTTTEPSNIMTASLLSDQGLARLVRNHAPASETDLTTRRDEGLTTLQKLSPAPSKISEDAHSPASREIPQSRPQVRRKPVSRSSLSEGALSGASNAVSNHIHPYQARNGRSSTSPTDSAYSVMEKLTPLTHSLSSLNANEYLNVELDQPQVQPYLDDPPVYSLRSAPPIPSSSRREPAEVIALRQRHAQTLSSIQSGNTLLFQLVKENRVNEIQKMLEDGYNVNEMDDRTGRTVIMEASRLRRFEACRVLLQSGARLHLKDSNGDSCLHLAASEGDAEITQMLLDFGALSQDCNKDGRTPLELAAAGGHTETVLRLVNIIPSRKPNDATLVKAFLEAVKTGDVNTAQIFLTADVRPKKIKEPWKSTAYAAQSGSLPMMDLMLAQKCNVRWRSPAGWTPLHFAASHGHQPMVEKLLALRLSGKAETKKTKETPLHLATVHGHTGTAMALLARKDAPANVKDAESQEPIHHAVRNGDIKLMAALIEEGAKLSNANKYGWKAIHLAAAYGHVSLLAECMTRGVNIEEKLVAPSFKPEKRTNAAAKRGFWAEIRWPHAGARPLHLALEFAHDDVATMLISGAAKVDEADSRGWRPLHHAAFACRTEMVRLLLQKGATPDAKTDDGHTPATLGFREYGLTADHNQRMSILEMLQIAMANQKRSKIRSLKSFMNPGSSQSKTAAQRNLAWHTAQLAEALYQTSDAAEGEDDEYSMDYTEVSVPSISDADASQLYEPQLAT